jgi:hypothetical protein
MKWRFWFQEYKPVGTRDFIVFGRDFTLFGRDVVLFHDLLCPRSDDGAFARF